MIRRWESTKRYYVARMEVDLFGTWVICRAWGGLGNRLGNTDTQPVASFSEGLARLEQLGKERAKRKYKLVRRVL